MFSDDGYETEILTFSCLRVVKRDSRSGEALPKLVVVLWVLPLLCGDSWWLEPRPRCILNVKRCSSNRLPIPFEPVSRFYFKIWVSFFGHGVCQGKIELFFIRSFIHVIQWNEKWKRSKRKRFFLNLLLRWILAWEKIVFACIFLHKLDRRIYQYLLALNNMPHIEKGIRRK